MEFGVSMFLRPEIERDGGEFVYEGVGETVLGEVDGLDVGVASVAALDADVREFGGGVHGKLGVVFLPAAGADNAAEFPLGEANTAEQAAAAAVSLRAKHSGGGLAIAEWTQQRRVAFQSKRSAGAGELGGRLLFSGTYEEILKDPKSVKAASGKLIAGGTWMKSFPKSAERLHTYVLSTMKAYVVGGVRDIIKKSN